MHDAISDPAAGGAIAVRNASTIQIITSAFTENVAENGGAVYLETCGKASLADNTFTSNRANKQGGGLFQTKCSGMGPTPCKEGAYRQCWTRQCSALASQASCCLTSGGLSTRSDAGKALCDWSHRRLLSRRCACAQARSGRPTSR